MTNKKTDISKILKEKGLFRDMVKYCGDEIVLTDNNGNIVFANQAASKALGYSLSTLLKMNITSLFKKKISISSWKRIYFNEIKKRKTPVSYLIERVAKGKKFQTVNVTAVFMEYFSCEFVLTVARDITSQLELQNKLVESQDQYRIVSEQAVIGIVTIDLSGAIVYANNAAEKMVNVPFSESRGTSFTRYIAKNSIKKAMEIFAKVMKGIPTVTCEIEVSERGGGTMPVDVTVSPICRDGKVYQANIILKNIRDKKNCEALEKESEKQEALQQVISGTAQEIQGPLIALYESTNNMLSEYKDRYFEYIGYKEFKDIMSTLEIMRDQIKYCYDTTERLMDLNKRRIGYKNNNADVNSTIKNAIKQVKQVLDLSDIKLKLDLGNKLPKISIRELELSQVVICVLTNAAQALPSGGNITLTSKVLPKKKEVVIECKDDGIGIPKEVISKVFDPFFTTKDRGLMKNSGLGLSIAHSLVKSSRGNISINSVFRKGTVVRITLPIAKKNPKAKKKK